jgi:hypothetical protein
MPEVLTHADSIRLFHTGSASPRSAQADPDDSLGGWPSSSEVASLQASIANPILGITVDHVGGLSGNGTAYITAPAVGTLQYKAPGSSTYGAAVAIANGETKLLEDGDNASRFIRVTRTSADDLTGTATLTLAIVLNNAIGMDNVSAAESSAGDTEYRCLALANDGADEVANIGLFIEPITSAQNTDDGVLPSAGSGTIGTTGSFAGWSLSGHAAIFTSAGALREVVYYSGRTDSDLTVPTAGRSRLGTSAAAGAADDTIRQVPGIAIAVEAAHAIGAATFTGAGLDDLTAGGTLTAWIPRQYRVEIDATGTPDTFQWSHDGGSTWEATSVAITGSAQTLENGITVTFAATTGHTSGDRWDFDVARAEVVATEGDSPAATFSTPYESADALSTDDLDTGEVAYLWIKRDVVAGSVASTKLASSIVREFEAT